MIGCDCAVCQSTDPRDQRLRASALLSDGALNLLVDAGPDLRQQMLLTQVKHLDAILLTHEHNDHVIGLDDVRPFNFRSGKAIEVYALARVANEVRRRFDYVFGEPIPGLPRIELKEIDGLETLAFNGTSVRPVEVLHGYLPIVGFRFGDLAYLTDVKTLPPTAFPKLTGLRYLVVNALHHTPHPTHMNLQEALELIKILAPAQTWLTHISHSMGKTADLGPTLPPNVQLAYDGLTIQF